MKRKILLFPTYFPNTSNSIVGSQVHEQTEIMNEFYDFRVIFCKEGMGMKRFIFHTILSWLTGKSYYQSCVSELAPGNLEVFGVYYFSSKYLSENQNIKLRVKAYDSVMNKILKDEMWTPDLLHARTAEIAGVHAAYISKKHKIPLLLTENCIFIIDKTINLQRINNYRFAIESATQVAVVSHYLKAFLLANKFSCQPIIIGNMIDDAKFTISKKSNDVFTIFTVGHTGFTKDWPCFFRVIKDLVYNKDYKDIKVDIAVTQVYDDITKNMIPSLAKEYGVSDFCNIYNEVSRDKIIEFFQNSDVFVSTSVNETFGIATLESMFCGVPVIATRNGGIEDFIANTNGRLVDIGDHEGIAKYISEIKNKKLTFEPQLIRDSVFHKYCKESFIKRLSIIYDNCI